MNTGPRTTDYETTQPRGTMKPKKLVHLTQRPHPQPLSHPMGEGGVGLSGRGGEGVGERVSGG